MCDKTLGVKEKMSYGAASMGDTAIYNLLIIYSLFFMTDIVKLDPMLAGSITFIATVCNAFFIGAIGRTSDKGHIGKGKRVPYMEIAILPMAIGLIMFFTVIHKSQAAMTFYYMIAMTLLMVSHSSFMVPYEALGADLAIDSKNRNAIRSYARFFMGLGNIVGVVFILPITNALQDNGVSTSRSWQVTIIAVAALGAISQIATCKAFHGRESIDERKHESENVLKEYLEILKLRPMIVLLIVTLIISLANVFCNSGIVYFMKYNLEIAEDSKALILGVMAVTGIVMTPILSACSKRQDKKTVMMAAYTITGIIFMFFWIAGIGSLISACIYIAVFTVGMSAYWQFIYAMFYDIREVHEFKCGQKRGAAILSISKIVLRLSNAASAQILAIILELFGYDQNIPVQSTKTLIGIECSITLIPGLLFLAAAVLLKIYPISASKHARIVKALQHRGAKERREG